MKKIIIFLLMFFIMQPVYAFGSPEKAVKNLLVKQIKYANRCDLTRFISTYDKDYLNSDGFNLEIYSNMVKDVWDNYKNIKYNIKIKDIKVAEDEAKVELTEYTSADLALSRTYSGALNSESESIYYLKKVNGKWKVYSDKVLSETTTMLYGATKNLDIKLTVPESVNADTEYTASLEFVTPKGMLAIASLTADKVEYPQKQSPEVYRAMPEDNILERLFTANSDNVGEYIVASIGLTQTDICDLSIKMSLAGFGYVIKRVNVISEKTKENTNE